MIIIIIFIINTFEHANFIKSSLWRVHWGMTKSPRAADRSDRRPETSASAVSISDR